MRGNSLEGCKDGVVEELVPLPRRSTIIPQRRVMLGKMSVKECTQRFFAPASVPRSEEKPGRESAGNPAVTICERMTLCDPGNSFGGLSRRMPSGACVQLACQFVEVNLATATCNADSRSSMNDHAAPSHGRGSLAELAGPDCGSTDNKLMHFG